MTDSPLVIATSIDIVNFLRAAAVDGSEPTQVLLGLANTEGRVGCWTICGAAVRTGDDLAAVTPAMLCDLADELLVGTIVLAEVGEHGTDSWLTLRDECAERGTKLLDLLILTADDFISAAAVYTNTLDRFGTEG